MLPIIFIVVGFIFLGTCSSCTAGITTPVSTPADSGDYVIGSTESGLPVVLPTYNLTQPANINPGKIIGSVYTSDRDHYFHKADCPNLSLINTPVNRQSAIIQGYSACPVCNP